jgi:hypothetical protein
MSNRLILPCALSMLIMTMSTGCRTYEITQFDNEAIVTFRPAAYKRAAIITHHQEGSGHKQNKLFLEAFQVELMKRGIEVVEREKFEKLVNEQLLIQGELADLSDREKALRVGKLLNVDVVFYGDALENQSYYTYEPVFLLSSEAQARILQEQANQSGVVEDVGRFKIHAYHNVGVTVRAIDASSGEIVWVGYRMLAVCEEVTEKSPTALTNFSTIKKLCGKVLNDFNSPRNVNDNERGA